jgi:uncharacterized protein YegL
MSGEKISTVNHAIQEAVPDMKDAADDNPNARLLVRILKFSTGAEWVTEDPVGIEDFSWDDLSAGGVTDLGRAFDLLSEQLTIPPMSDRALPPVMVLLSDGQPTDDYRSALERLLNLPWGRKSVRVAISIGQDADDDMLYEFTGSRDLILPARNASTLAKMIKWASTVASMVSSPLSRHTEADGSENAPVFIDMNNIPSPEEVMTGDVW